MSTKKKKGKTPAQTTAPQPPAHVMARLGMKGTATATPPAAPAHPPGAPGFAAADEEGKLEALRAKFPAEALLRAFQGPANHWHKRVLYAWLRGQGVAQGLAAKAVGRSADTTRGWEGEDNYLLAIDHARTLWEFVLADLALVGLMDALEKANANPKNDGYLALKAAERPVPWMAPPPTTVVRNEVNANTMVDNRTVQYDLTQLGTNDLEALQRLLQAAQGQGPPQPAQVAGGNGKAPQGPIVGTLPVQKPHSNGGEAPK